MLRHARKHGPFYAWDAILRHEDSTTRINLLLNRASPWLDIDSYLPYEGKVELRNKTTQQAFVRIPLWIDRKAIRCTLGQKELPKVWFGNYLRFDRLRPNDVLTLRFPMVETTGKYTIVDGFHPVPRREYAFSFQGNTVVDISPHQGRLAYPIYLRERYRANKTPMKKVTRFVPEATIEW